jgi:hypothetical protein
LQMALNVREISFLDPLDRDLMITLGPLSFLFIHF